MRTRSRRFLRPGHAFFASGFVWVVDDYQPVAVLLDPSSNEFVQFVSWGDLPPAPQGSRRRAIVADPAGIWVQDHLNGPLARVTADGIAHAEYIDQHHVICAGASGAWCAKFPRRGLGGHLMVALPHGGTRTVRVGGRLVSLESDEMSLFVGIEHDSAAVPVSTSVLRVPLDGPVPDEINVATHPREPQRTVDYTSEYADQLYNEAHRRKRTMSSSVRWHWGLDPEDRETTLVRAFRASQCIRSIKLAGCRVVDGAAAVDRIWLVAYSPRGETTVLTGSVHSDDFIPLPIQLDITDHCWSIAPEPLDHDSYVRWCLRKFDGRRFSDHVTDVKASYVGGWPDGQIELRFRHVDYAGLTLVTRINLYDENGLRLANLFAHVDPSLIEQADTRAYPPRTEAVDGVLYV